MRAFVTGGTGFIGRAVTRSLLARQFDVVVLVRRVDSPQTKVLIKSGARTITGDIAQRDTMLAGMKEADLVVHNAAHYEFGLNRKDRQRMQETNVKGTECVLGLAHELGIPRTLYVSTVLAYGDTGPRQRNESFIRAAPCRTIYEKSKTEAHEVALRYIKLGLPLVIVCPNAVIGPNDHSVWGYFLRMYLNRILPPLCWSPDTIFCCVHVNDLAEGIALAIEKGSIGETYLLGGEPKSFREIMNFWRQRPGAFRHRIWLPGGLASAFFAPMEPLLRILDLPAFLSRETARAGSTNMFVSNEKAKKELGWKLRSAESAWIDTMDRELELLKQRKGQSWIQRLKPLETDEALS
jgi:dihydroflavonol-4-reductase